MNAKAQVRQNMRQILADLTPAFKNEASLKICRHLADYLATFPAEKIAIFAATANEADLAALHHLLPTHEIHYPLCAAESKMTFHHVPKPAQLLAGKHGIAAPDPTRHPLVKPEGLDLICCPGLAFTKRGHRLGQGGGYYDRYLPQATRATILGVAFSSQLIPEIPILSHDSLVHQLITECGQLSCS